MRSFDIFKNRIFGKKESVVTNPNKSFRHKTVLKIFGMEFVSYEDTIERDKE
jgi:hypothetical protein